METTFAAPPAAARAIAAPGARDDAASSEDRVRQSREIVSHLQRSEIYRTYEDAFQATTGLPLALRAIGAFNSSLKEAKNVNPFCTFVATANKTCAACLRLQQEVEESAVAGPCTLECYSGLTESAVPIRVGENVVAYLRTGQVMLRRPSTARFR